MRFFAILLLAISCGSAVAQSWVPADRLGRNRIKSWDDIPGQTSSSAEILQSISSPEGPSVSIAPESSSAFYDRRQLPESGSLKSYFEQVLALSDERVVKSAGLRLQLPDSVGWFTSVYGADVAVPLEKEYSALRAGWVKQFGSLVKGLRGRGQTAVSVQVIRGARDPDAQPAQRQVMAAMHQPQQLYTVKFVNTVTREQHVLYSFAYVDGAFRFVGTLSAAHAPPPSADQTPQPQ